MKFFKFILRLIFVFLCASFLYYLLIKYFNSIFISESIIFPYAFHPFDLCEKIPKAWHYIKLSFKLSLFFNLIIIFNSFFSYIFPNKKNDKNIKENINTKKIRKKIKYKKDELYLLVGKNTNNVPIYINEKALFQNILVTGTIGSGKTSSVMYPFCKQLIFYLKNNIFKKIGMLILDVKGNFYKQVLFYANLANRLDDVIVIELNGKYKYNPLHKPELSPQTLANRLKTILLLFSPNNSENYWLDEAEKVLSESIKLCRLYNDGYVTFKEIHKLITRENYYIQKLDILKTLFRSGKLSKTQVYDLHSSLLFFENEFLKLDPRVLSILKSEITRITSTFISNYDILNTFSPEKKDLNFLGFKDVIKNRKNCCLKYEYFRI